MSENDLSKIIDKSYSVFRKKNVVDLIKIGDRSVLELFHGPTMAFKDVGARFTSRCISYLNKLKKYNCPLCFIAGKKRTNVFGIPKVVKVETTIAYAIKI